jgi:hypothetical protein
MFKYFQIVGGVFVAAANGPGEEDFPLFWISARHFLISHSCFQWLPG